MNESHVGGGFGRRIGPSAQAMTDRDAAKEVLFRLRLMHPENTIVGADSAYAGQLVDWAKKYLNPTLKTVNAAGERSGSM